MQQVKCPICSSISEYSTSVEFNSIAGIIDYYKQDIFVCNNCEFIFTNNYLDDKLIENYYKNISKYEGNNEGIIDNTKKMMTKRQFSFISSIIEDYNTVLEVGASTGFNLNTFKKRGKEVFGVEPSSKNKVTAKKIYEIDLFDGMYNEFYEKYKQNKYDLIFMSHVLEHVFNPQDVIKKLATQNSKYIYIEVPSFEVQLESEPYGSFFYEHVNYFTINSLSYLMKINGYSSVKLSIDYNVKGESPGYPVICSLWEKSNDKGNLNKDIISSSLLVKNYLLSSEKNFKKIREKIDNIPNSSRLAIWGTGSHTSRLLGMTSLKNKNIIKFYDSDKKKHQFKILNKTITSFNKEDIQDIDIILISTFSGEKSILNILKKEKLNLEIISLYN